MKRDYDETVVSGPCNRCNAEKTNVLGLCGACGRFPITIDPEVQRAKAAAAKAKKRGLKRSMGWSNVY